MKRFILKIGKCLIVYIVVIMILLTGVSYGYSQSEVGSAVSGYACYIANNYSSKIEYSQSFRDKNPIWNSSRSWGDDEMQYFDCSSFATGCYYAVTGLLSSAPATSELKSFSSSDFDKKEVNSISDLEVGDLVFWNDGSGGHALIYVGNDKFCEVGGSSGNIGYRDASYYISQKIEKDGKTVYCMRISSSTASSLTNLNTDFSSTVVGSTYSNNTLSEFYFNGIPDGKYSIANTNVLEILIDTLASVADYLIGIITYIIRIVIVGWTSIIDRLFSWTVNSIVESGSTEDLGISGTEVEEYQDTNTRITIEKIFYNQYDLLNINIFE